MAETRPDTQRSPAGTPEKRRPGLHLAFADGLARSGESVPLGHRGEVVLGRDAALFEGGPLDDPRMSQRHARLFARPGGWCVEDLGSTNGTFVNGQRLAEGHSQRLLPGDVLRVGRALLVFADVVEAQAEEGGAQLIGGSAELALLRDEIARVAPTRAHVLVTGETGTGKELVARALHEGGDRGVLVAVNCARLSHQLQSELFGHLRGAFTGAETQRSGLLERADGGTLFLDELAEMPLEVQAELLRVLECGVFRPVGGDRERQVNLRVVAATHVDLPEAVREGRFRKDFYARLSQWELQIPPLRDRREDILPIAASWFAGGPAPDSALAEAMLLAPWPLNVRALRDFVAAVAIEGQGEARVPLLPSLAKRLARQTELLASSDEAKPVELDLEALRGAYEGANHNVSAAARSLGISRPRFYRLARKLGLEI